MNKYEYNNIVQIVVYTASPRRGLKFKVVRKLGIDRLFFLTEK
jgi:hypothetical protein